MSGERSATPSAGAWLPLAFYSVRIDDPCLPAPIHAVLFRSRDADHRYDLVWNRLSAAAGGVA